jgi:hypothetical protein
MTPDSKHNKSADFTDLLKLSDPAGTGVIKIYHSFDDPDGFKRKIDAALHVRAYAAHNKKSPNKPVTVGEKHLGERDASLKQGEETSRFALIIGQLRACLAIYNILQAMTTNLNNFNGASWPDTIMSLRDCLMYLEDLLSGVGDDAQLATLNLMQGLQQPLQIMSDIMKILSKIAAKELDV